jgi:hypothetical protein
MATTISTKNIGTVREIRRTTRIYIASPVNEPVVISANRETILCDETDTLIAQKPSGSVTRNLPDVQSEEVTLPDGLVLSAAQVALAVELFIEKWDAPTATP